ncbi:MAG: PAS domain-containing protein [Gammaproteobacteria bacterium]|nr:PAS domain-containing protein [Gammaproteobacteria bacterium]
MSRCNDTDLHFETLFARSPDPCFLARDGRYIDCNPAAVRILKASTKADIIGRQPADISPKRQPNGESSRERAEDMIKIAVNSGCHRFEWTYRALDGEEIVVDVVLTLITSAEGGLVHSMWHEVGTRKKVEKSIRDSRDLLNKIIDFLPDATVIIDSAGTVLFWNRAMEEMTHTKAADVIGKGNYTHALPFYGARRPILIDLVFRRDNEYAKHYPYMRRHGDILTGEAYVPALGLYLYGNASVLRDSSGAVIGAIESLRDITEEKATERNLIEALSAAETARREAEKANQTKARFLAAASHDLRQPAHAQGLFLDVLARTALDESQRELLANARALAGATTEMLHALLDFSRIEAGVVEPRPCAFRMQDILNKIEREFGPQADAKGLVYRTRDTNLIVQSDPTLVELVARNLVSNAIRYTTAGGVLVSCRRRAGKGWLEIWDTGIGIASEDKKAIFHEFLQLGNPERDRRKGLGLGLAIADGLARRLKHRLTLVSQPGRGSVFRLAMPLAEAALPVSEPVPLKPMHAQAHTRVLFIDDDEAVRLGMYHLLALWGYECSTVESIDEALAVARQWAPDVVLSDYRLRGHETGADAINALRVLLGEDLPALLVTGDTAPERLAEAHACGVPLLHKPVPPDELQRALVSALATVPGR